MIQHKWHHHNHNHHQQVPIEKTAGFWYTQETMAPAGNVVVFTI